jgi:RNA polymerase sigma-70 factor (ECF subfamily)
VLANFIAQHGRRLRTSQPVPENRAGGSRNGPSNLLRSEERRAGALRKLEHLSERQRRVVELRLWEDLPFAECGRRLDITENLARVTFHRALARLREVTGNEE